jgi:hypothetical protein
MRRSRHKVAILAILLALVFVAAQLHFCTDVTSAPSHLCPVRSTADSVAATALIQDTGLGLSHRVEVPAALDFVSIVLPSVISRGPPAL